MVRRRKAPRRRHVLIKPARSRDRHHISLNAVPNLEKFRQDMERSRRQKERKDLAESLDFLDWITKQTRLPVGPDVHWTAPVFRLMYGGAPPLSITGSFGAGGRFNAGMAQMSSHFPNLKPQGCLYAASTLECCYAEAQPPLRSSTAVSAYAQSVFCVVGHAKSFAALLRSCAGAAIIECTPGCDLVTPEGACDFSTSGCRTPSHRGRWHHHTVHQEGCG